MDTRESATCSFHVRPDWRWREARSRVGRHEHPGPDTDRWTIAACDALRWLTQGAPGSSDASLAQDARAVVEALRLREEEPFRRALEALLLAGLPAAAIAEYLGLPANRVAGFQHTFFDLGEIREVPGRMGVMLDHQMRQPLEPEHRLWMLGAVHLGAEATKQLIERRPLSATTREALHGLALSEVCRKALAACVLMPVNEKNASQVARLSLALRHDEKHARAETSRSKRARTKDARHRRLAQAVAGPRPAMSLPSARLAALTQSSRPVAARVAKDAA